jgi:putative sterol carrier protein
MVMGVADIESIFASRLDQFGALDAKLKFDFGDDTLFIDGTQTPATLSHADDDADTTIVISPADLEKILHGQLDATMAFMTGKLKVKGSTALALKLANILK